jgi:hypothetical protein
MCFGPLVDAGTQDWVIENFEWAVDQGILNAETVLRPPTATVFPTPKGTPQEVARGLVDVIAKYLGITTEIDLRPLDEIPQNTGSTTTR